MNEENYKTSKWNTQFGPWIKTEIQHFAFSQPFCIYRHISWCIVTGLFDYCGIAVSWYYRIAGHSSSILNREVLSWDPTPDHISPVLLRISMSLFPVKWLLKKSCVFKPPQPHLHAGPLSFVACQAALPTEGPGDQEVRGHLEHRGIHRTWRC